MELNIIHSDSDGNCCVLTDKNGNQLLLDCGLDFEQIIPHINFNKLDALMLTHSHQDHSLSKKKFEKFYIHIFDTTNVKDNAQIALNNWIIIPMKLLHNVPCFGYLIYSRNEKKKVAYITDTTYIPKMGKVDCLICDCNYDMAIVDALAKTDNPAKTGYKNHLSIQAVEMYIKELPYTLSCFVAYHLSNSGLINVKKVEETFAPLVEKLVIAKPNTKVEI